MLDQNINPVPAQLPMVVRDLVFSMADHKLVDIARLDIRAGGPTVILGPNGAGKSLLLRLLHGLIEPTSGTVHFARLPADRPCRRGQAMVFQSPVLLRRSVAANVAYALATHGTPRKHRKSQIVRFLEKGGLLDHENQPARSLSGGEQQRLALVRALACEPALLFLDEPTSSLDPASTDAIETLIMDAVNTGTKVIMVTHDLGLARRIAEDIVFLNSGAVTEHISANRFFDAPTSKAAQAYLAKRLVLPGAPKHSK